MTDYLNPDKLYPDDISRRIDTPPEFDSVRTPTGFQRDGGDKTESRRMANQCICCGQEMPEGDHVCTELSGRQERVWYTRQHPWDTGQEYRRYVTVPAEGVYRNEVAVDFCPFCGEELPPVETPQYTGKLYFQEDVEVNKNGNNVKLKCHLLPEEQMRDIGFTDCRKDTWFYYRTVHPSMDISFSVSINKVDETVFGIDVIDEDFGQPYDYQRILRKDPQHLIALDIKSKVEDEMQKLMALGVVSGHVFDQYI